MLKNRANLLAATIAALACSGAIAQQSGTPAPNGPTPSAAQPAALAQQPGVVYPGRAPTESASAPASAPAAPVGAGVAPQALPGQGAAAGVPTPGARVGQVAPNVPAMPPLPSASQLYVNDNMPADLTDAVREYKRRFDENLRASSQFTNPAPKPKSSTITITQAPGEMAPTVRLGSGIPTNIVFTDATGAPWPIEFATPGDRSIVDVLLPVEGTSTVQIRPKQPYMYGAVSINLKDNPVPITLILASAQSEVDTRIDVRLSRRGPNAQAPIIDRPGFTNVDSVLLAVLDGVPPSDAQGIRSSEGALKAWNHKGRLYVRTTLPVVSPAYSDTAASVDGTRVYAMPSVPFVTVSIDGVLRTVRLGD